MATPTPSKPRTGAFFYDVPLPTREEVPPLEIPGTGELENTMSADIDVMPGQEQTAAPAAPVDPAQMSIEDQLMQAVLEGLKPPEKKKLTKKQKGFEIARQVLTGLFIGRNPEMASTVLGNRRARESAQQQAQRDEQQARTSRANTAINVASMIRQSQPKPPDTGSFRDEVYDPETDRMVSKNFITRDGRVVGEQELGIAEAPEVKERKTRGFLTTKTDPETGLKTEYRMIEDAATGEIVRATPVGGGPAVNMQSESFNGVWNGQPVRIRHTVNPFTGDIVKTSIDGMLPPNQEVIESNRGMFTRDKITGAITPLLDENGDQMFGPISEAEARGAAQAVNLRKLIDDAEASFNKYVDKRSRLERGGLSFVTGLPFGFGELIDEFFVSHSDPETSDLSAKLNNIADILVRVRSGAQVSVEETRKLRNLLPKLGESAEAAEMKFRRFEGELLTVLRSKAVLQPQLFTDQFISELGLTREDIFGSAGREPGRQGEFSGRTLRRSEVKNLPQSEIDRFVNGGGNFIEDAAQ